MGVNDYLNLFKHLPWHDFRILIYIFTELLNTDISRYPVRDDEVLVTHKVYFDITVGGNASRRVEFGLFGSVVPQTVANFLALAQGKDVWVQEIDDFTHFGFNGTLFGRITPWYLQGKHRKNNALRWVVASH